MSNTEGVLLIVSILLCQLFLLLLGRRFVRKENKYLDSEIVKLNEIKIEYNNLKRNQKPRILLRMKTW